METNYRIAYDHWWKDLKSKQPEEITTRLDVTYCSIDCKYTVIFFNSEYILDCCNETIYRKIDGQVPEIIASIIILNYLTYAQLPKKTTKEWVSLKEFSSGGSLFYPAFHKSSIVDLITTFGHNSQQLLTCATALGGQPASLGDASVIFHAFPEIALCVVVWEGDDEVEANATMLFDPSTEPLLHIESTIGLGMYLASELKKQVMP